MGGSYSPGAPVGVGARPRVLETAEFASVRNTQEWVRGVQ